jgi:hypothetical protein
MASLLVEGLNTRPSWIDARIENRGASHPPKRMIRKNAHRLSEKIMRK